LWFFASAGNGIREKTSSVVMTNGMPAQTKAVAQDNPIAFDTLNRTQTRRAGISSSTPTTTPTATASMDTTVARLRPHCS